MATAFDLSYPYDGVDAFEEEWRDMFRALGSGVVAGLANELAVFGDSSGRQVKVPTGAIWAAGQFGRITSQKTLAVAANGAGQPRIDRAVVRNVFGSGIELDVLTGTPGASPSPPTLTSDGTMQEFSLAKIGPLAAGFTTVAAGQVTSEALYVSLFGPPATDVTGTVLTPWIPAFSAGMMLTNRDSGGLYVYDGSTFVQLRRESAANASTPGGNIDLVSGSYVQFPGTLALTVDVPAWATRARASAVLSQANATGGDLNHALSLVLSTIHFQDKNSVSWPDGSSGDIVFAGDEDVSALAGSPALLEVTGKRNAGSGTLRLDTSSSCFIEVEFR